MYGRKVGALSWAWHAGLFGLSRASAFLAFSPKAKHARIVVLRNKAFPDMFDTGWQAQLDGVAMGHGGRLAD
jgi:hypothetical protein